MHDIALELENDDLWVAVRGVQTDRVRPVRYVVPVGMLKPVFL